MSRAILVLTLVVGTAIHSAKAADPLDWPYWRGPESNSVSRETGLPDTMNPDGGPNGNLLWKSEAAGGRSTPIVLNGRLYTIVRDQPGTSSEGEKVVCLDAATGELKWEKRFNVWSSDVPDTRVGWSSAVADPDTGRVYALGVCGLFQCYEGDSGKIVWSIPLHEQFGMLSTYGGRTNFPVVVDDLVILGAVIVGWGDMAVPAHRILAFDKATGEVAWFTSTKLRPEDTIYSGPTVAVLGGQKLLLTGSGDGWLYALQPRTGKIVWEFQVSKRGLNLSPTVVGETIYIGHSEENPKGTEMGAVVAIDGTMTGNVTEKAERWRVNGLGVGKSSILHVDFGSGSGLLYCLDDAGKLYALDMNGQQVGRKVGLGTINHASPIFADGKIYHVEKNGRWYILTPDEKEGVKKFKKGETTGTFPEGDECWASPVVSHGRLYIQTTGALYCFADTSKKLGSTPRPANAAESELTDKTAAHVQVLPAEILMKPGEKKTLKAIVYNKLGQRIELAKKVEFSLNGPGKIVDGVFEAPADQTQAATIVTAKVGDLEGASRIRIVPPLPWKFDFEGLTDAPITWIGARYRHRVGKVEGNSTLVKITTIPKGTRSRAWFGHPDLHDYTVQADMKPSIADNKLPDMGLICQGYKFAMEGLNNRILLNSWDSHDYRTSKVLPFKMEPDVWYVMKIKVSNDGPKARVQGKVWKRGESEPANWSIEMDDDMPNKQGSPGMTGNATNAEITIDNVMVTPNS